MTLVLSASVTSPVTACITFSSFTVFFFGFVWAMIFGYYLFAEVPTNWTLAGATLIMAACLFATFSAPRARPA